MTEDRLKSLLFKHMAKNLTEDERHELEDCAAKHPEVWRLIARLDNQDQFMRDLRKLHQDRSKKLGYWSRLKKSVRAFIDRTLKNKSDG